MVSLAASPGLWKTASVQTVHSFSLSWLRAPVLVDTSRAGFTQRECCSYTPSNVFIVAMHCTQKSHYIPLVGRGFLIDRLSSPYVLRSTIRRSPAAVYSHSRFLYLKPCQLPPLWMPDCQRTPVVNSSLQKWSFRRLGVIPPHFFALQILMRIFPNGLRSPNTTQTAPVNAIRYLVPVMHNTNVPSSGPCSQTRHLQSGLSDPPN